MAEGAIRVKGLADLNRALKRTSKDVRLGIRKELRSVAEPIRREAEGRALDEISGMRKSPQWSEMRVGLTLDSVYVAPRPRGVKRGNDRGRPNLAGRLMDDAMQPALDAHAGEVAEAMDDMLGRVANGFSRG